MSEYELDNDDWEAGDTELDASEITQRSKAAIMRAARAYNVSSSEIINLAPVLFTLVAEKSLLKRRKRLDELWSFYEHAKNSMSGIAAMNDYLNAPVRNISNDLQELIENENESVKRREVHGASQTLNDPKFEELIAENPDSDPLLQTIQELAEGIDPNMLSDLHLDDEDQQINFRCCEGPREQKIRRHFADWSFLAERLINGEITLDEAEKQAEGMELDDTPAEDDLDLGTPA